MKNHNNFFEKLNFVLDSITVIYKDTHELISLLFRNKKIIGFLVVLNLIITANLILYIAIFR